MIKDRVIVRFLSGRIEIYGDETIYSRMCERRGYSGGVTYGVARSVGHLLVEVCISIGELSAMSQYGVYLCRFSRMGHFQKIF